MDVAEDMRNLELLIQKPNQCGKRLRGGDFKHFGLNCSNGSNRDKPDVDFFSLGHSFLQQMGCFRSNFPPRH